MKSIRIHETMSLSEVNGPGRRYVVWVQGCSNNCPECENIDAKDKNGGKLVEIEKLAKEISKAIKENNLEGITFTGGEPLEQLSECADLIEEVKKECPKINIVTYTGNVLSKEYQEILKRLGFDLVIDGPFMKEKKINKLPWRGSSNQRLLYLTKKISPEREREGFKRVEIIIKDDQRIMTGFVPEGYRR